MKNDFVYDLIIVGSGLSALYSAKILTENKIESILMIESKNRIGGKMKNEEIKISKDKTITVDSGAAFIGKIKQYNSPIT